MIECGVSYFGVRRTVHVQRDMEEIAEQGATFVVHTFTEQDLRTYFETMRDIVRVTKEADLDVWLDPVGLGAVFAGDDFLSDYVLLHPETAQLDSSGVSLPAACPNHSEYRRFMRSWVDKVIDLGGETIFWDEPHLFLGEWFEQSDRWGCSCPLCQQKYAEAYGGPIPSNSSDESLLRFQSDTILEFLDHLLTYAQNQGVKNIVTLLPYEFQHPGALNWDSVAALPAVHNLGTDPYPFPSFANQNSYADRWQAFVREYAIETVELCKRHGKENHLWLQGFSLPADDKGYLDNVMDIALDAGITTLAAWGFDGHRDMSKFACENPDLVWQKIGQGFRRIRGLSQQPRATTAT